MAEEEEIPIRVYEERETLDLFNVYYAALKEAHPDYSDEQISIITYMVIKKAKYGIEYEEEVENLIDVVNASIRAYYSS